MKRIIFWIGALLIVAACSTQKSAVKVESRSNDKIVEDSVEYGMETFDAKFKTWYLLHNNPTEHRSQEYYENWNRQYVSVWNIHVNSGRKSSFFESIIGYDPNVDYGFELNHELFYYFQYVEHVLKIEIMPGAPKTIRY
ncbi:MAG: membrane lipoprotein lipid attachment site-containing protein [Bacteroidetes bacterium]|nr:membrane lipoprotein lipid attachment site-containing protein [Bacteroidota bacterium]